MKFAIVLAAICFLGVAFAAPAPAADAAAKPNAFADWQKSFQETLNKLLGQNKTKSKRDLTGDILTAVMNMNNPIVLAQTMFKIMTQLNSMGQNKTAEASAPAGNFAGDAIALLTKTNDPMAFAGQLFKVVNTLAKDNKVVIPAGAAKPKFNFLQNPVLKNPNWNKKPATEAEAVVEVESETVEEVAEDTTEAAKPKRELYKKTPTGWKKASDLNAAEEVVEDTTEVAVERVARQERLPEWEPTFKDQMRSNAYGIVGVGQLLEYLDDKKAKKAEANKPKRDAPTEAEAAPAAAASAQSEFTIHDLGKMVDNFYAQFQAPKKSA